MSQSPSRARMRLEQLFRDTVARLDPGPRVRRAILDLPWPAERAVVVALGKAAATMFAGARAGLSERGMHLVGAAVVAPGPARERASDTFQVAVGSHPVPDNRSVRAAELLVHTVRSASPRDEIIALVSGGGSALAALPAPGLSLADKVRVTRALAERGAPIATVNTVRKHLSAIKGGQLAAAAPVPITTLVVSDVVGDELATVASGPTIADSTSFADASAAIESWLGWSSVPASVQAHMRAGVAGRIADTPSAQRPGDRALLLAGTDTLIDTALACARARGWQAQVVGRALTGDVVQVADRLLSSIMKLVDNRPSEAVCLVAGGEPTLTLPDTYGRGGRAQHLALHLAGALAKAACNAPVQVLIAGSDGIDGNSDGAGAIVDGTTWARLKAVGVDPERALRECDSARALAAIDAQVVTGPTGVNHADLMIVTHGL